MSKFALKPWWDPFEEFDNLFERSLPKVWEREIELAPACDVYQDEKNVIVETSVPGVDRNDIDISIEDDILTIKGKTEKKEEIKKENYFRKEIRKGSFSRVVNLPVAVIADDAHAKFDNGILKITVPKAEPTKETKKIKVNIDQ